MSTLLSAMDCFTWSADIPNELFLRKDNYFKIIYYENAKL